MSSCSLETTHNNQVGCTNQLEDFKFLKLREETEGRDFFLTEYYIRGVKIKTN